VTKYVVDAQTLLHLAREQVAVSPEHELLAPTLVRSQCLSLMHEAVHRGELDDREAQAILSRVNRMKVRLLGDAVLRRTAWKIATELGWPTTYDAEYLALTQLQAKALVTLDDDLAQQVRDVVTTAPWEDLVGPG
jgi:indolepyruvate ferredoxin oxidoreductase alpha subunit